MATVMKQFRSTIPSCKYVFKSGKVAHFNCGVYNTSNEIEIKELEEELAYGNEFLLPSREVTADEIDPMSALRAKIIAEYEETKKLNPDRDMGTTTDKGGAGTGSLNTTKAAASASNSGATSGVKVTLQAPSK